MKHRFVIEVTTGAISRSIVNGALNTAIANVLTARDILECEVVFTAAGQDITAVVLPAGAQLALGLRVSPSEGAILARSEPHAMVDGKAQCVLSLNTEAIVALIAALPSSARSTNVFFEVEVVGPGGARRDTLAQQRWVLRCEVNMEDDAPQPLPLQTLFTNPVDFPANSETPGAPGDYAFNGDELAFYVPSAGEFRFVTLTAK